MKILRFPSFPIEGFTLVHCGAREESGIVFLEYFPGSRYIGFEPDKDECARLNEGAQEGCTYFPVAVGRKNEVRDLYLTKNPSCSSLFPPNRDFAGQFTELGSFLEVVGTQPINVVSLDEYLPEQGITTVDFLQVDTQGAELDILQGAEKLMLSGVLGIRAEVEFSPLYQDQPLFSDVDAWVCKFGFMLFDLDRYHVRRRNYQKYIFSKEQILWGQAIYLKDFHELHPYREKSKLYKLAVLASYYGFHSYAFDVLEFILQENNGIPEPEQMEIRKAREGYLKLLRRDRQARLFFFLGGIPVFNKLFPKLSGLTGKLKAYLDMIAAEKQYFWKD